MQNKTLQMKRAMRTALLVLLLSVAGMGKGYAYDFSAVCETGQTLYYNIIEATNNYVKLTYPGTDYYNGWSGYNEPIGDIVLPESVQYNNVIYSVTEIGSYAFYGCDNLTGSLTIPNSVTMIGNDAFHFCSGFTGALTIPNSVTAIGDAAFCKCSCTGNLNIPNSVTSIGEFAFALCYNFTGDLTIPNSVTTLGMSAFSGCEGLTGSLTISNSLTIIRPCTFNYCSGFTGNLTIPNSVTTIGYGAFKNCSGFTGSLTIPNSVTTIEFNAFVDCSGLTNVLIPNSVTSIGISTFAACTGLEYITVASGNPVYDSRNNCNAIIKSNTNELISGCKSTVIPDSVTTIGDYAFSGCSGLISVIIPNSVTTIGKSAFYSCDGLVGSLTIPKSITAIGDHAFYGCSSFSSITGLATTPPILGDEAFSSISSLTVPCDCAPRYQTSDWANYFTTIEEDCASHSINIDEGNISGGNVHTSVNSTNMGEEVQLTITPDEGMMLASLIVSNANDPAQTVPVYSIGKNSFIYGFIMPPFDVIITATFSPATTIGENNEALALVYPNPTNGQVKIEAENLKHITISNMLGQTIYGGIANGNEFTYGFSRHETGVYLIRIETTSGVTTKKVSVTQ